MRITYREGERLVLAEADELSAKGSTLTALLRSGKTLSFPFPSEEVLQEFFQEIVLTSGDQPIRLDFTSFDHRLEGLLDDWASMYDS